MRRNHKNHIGSLCSLSLLFLTIITQIALQKTSALSNEGRGRVGRNENAIGFKAILRISVA